MLDLALSRRIELAEARTAVAAAEVLALVRPELGVAVSNIAGGFAVYCGANSPLTQAVGIGLGGPVSDTDFDALEAFYASRNEPICVETSPLADRSLIELFGKRGYRVTEFTNVMGRPIHRSEAAEANRELGDEIHIERVVSEQNDLWNLTVAQGFTEHIPVTQEILDLMQAFASSAQVECYLARINGVAVGGGTMAVNGGIASLFATSTLPAYRNRGVQAALLERRVARAREFGCDLIVCLAEPGSTSQRNIVRYGFSVLYTRVKFERTILIETSVQNTQKMPKDQ